MSMQGVPGRALRILVADDSAVMRGIMRTLFATHAEKPSSELPKMTICGEAKDGVECLEMVKRLQPDVLLLDLEMPRMNGLAVLDQLRSEGTQVPVIMCSAYTEVGARSTMDALSRGASDYVMKPNAQVNFTAALQNLSDQLLPKIAALVDSWGRRRREKASVAQAISTRKGSEQRIASSGAAAAVIEVIVIGVSTGGPSALEVMLPMLPADLPVPVLIVQHMPKLFTGALAERLDRCCALQVKEAYEGAVPMPGTVWLAPGDMHMEVGWRGGPRRADRESSRRVQVCLHQERPLNYCRPSVDHLFNSAVQVYGAGTLAAVLTGMGADGLTGARAVHQAGGIVLAQDEASSAVWGMPGRVTEAGIASATLPLLELAAELTRRVWKGRSHRIEGPDVQQSLVTRGDGGISRPMEVTGGLY
jgi:two-component system chemotaxis response regulator CheB